MIPPHKLILAPMGESRDPLNRISRAALVVRKEWVPTFVGMTGGHPTVFNDSEH
jgi:hypothetical protein